MATTTPSDDTLSRAPAKALTFILAVGRTPAIWGALTKKGYDSAEHAAGWAKLFAVDPAMAKGAEAVTSTDPAVTEAFAKIDRWDNDNLPIADVALANRVPEAHAYVFANGLAPADGAESVRVVATFLDRVDAVEAIAEKPATHAKKPAKDADTPTSPPLTAAQAKAAMEILAARGITPAEREAARAWLATLLKGTETQPDQPSSAPTAPAAPTGSNRAAQVALYNWFTEWSTIARRVIARRDHLFSLGLATKKVDEKKAPAKKTDEKTDEPTRP